MEMVGNAVGMGFPSSDIPLCMDREATIDEETAVATTIMAMAMAERVAALLQTMEAMDGFEDVLLARM